MDYNKCQLFGVQSQKMIAHLLHIKDKKFFKQWYVHEQIHPYIERKDAKKRLIEPPSEELKRIQRRLKVLLDEIPVPSYVFSGVKGKSYVDNAKLHKGNHFVYKIDLTAFFPSTNREKAYVFFRDKLKTSPDVADILSNFVTVDIDLADCQDVEDINAFLIEKNVKTRKHLISGSPASQLLSYLLNADMFNELYKIASAHGMVMTVYVDDVTFSSNVRISRKVRESIIKTIHRFGFKESKKKVRSYSKNYPKLITGGTINKHGMCVVGNPMRYHIMTELSSLKKNSTDVTAKLRLQGLVSAARQIDPQIYPSIKALAYKK